MAFLKKADARVSHSTVGPSKGWGKAKVASGGVSKNIVEQASDILKEKFDPANYLLTHCTIVCSVGTEEVPNMRVGNLKEGSKTVNRLYPDFRITQDTQQYINGNMDAWSHNVLKKSYKSFVGAHNFCEHVQVEELSKGRIIDAALRDIGNSLYVDILVATHRKHAQLISDINSGRINALSMGCVTQNCTCTKCGNVAVDETQMCEHVLHQKGSVFYDEQGRPHKIAELCGHETYDDVGGVTFIEASWVAVPAFKGAVMRNILNMISPETVKMAQEMLASPPKKWSKSDVNEIVKAASIVSTVRQAQFDFGDEDEDDEGGGSEEDQSILSQTEDKLYKKLMQRVLQRADRDLSEDGNRPGDPRTDKTSMGPNQSLIKEASRILDRVYQNSLRSVVRVASSRRDALLSIAAINESFERRIPLKLYEVSLKVGSTTKYATHNKFLARCERALGRKPTLAEAKTLIRLGHYLALHDRFSGGK